MTHVLVTGGCGFIGSHFCEHLLARTDWRITVIDALTYAGDVARLTDQRIFDAKRVKVEWHDLRAPIGDSLTKRIGEVDHVINFASESHVERSIAEPGSFVMNNVALMVNVLDYVRKAKPKKFIQIGTDEVFGPAPEGVAFKEDDPHLPSNPYSASKAAQENICFAYWRTYGVPLIMTRTMNNFGERQHAEKLVPLAIGNLLAGVSTPVHARKQDGRWHAGSRIWLHARNHADAILFMLRNVEPTFFPAVTRPQRFNVVGDIELSNADIVQRIASVLEVSAVYHCVDFHSTRPGHDQRYALDGSLLRGLGWRPPVAFEASFRKTVRWYVANKSWLKEAL